MFCNHDSNDTSAFNLILVEYTNWSLSVFWHCQTWIIKKRSTSIRIPQKLICFLLINTLLRIIIKKVFFCLKWLLKVPEKLELNQWGGGGLKIFVRFDIACPNWKRSIWFSKVVNKHYNQISYDLKCFKMMFIFSR